MTESEQQIQREPVPKSEPVSQPAPSPLAPPTPPSRPRRRAVWIAGIIAVLLLTLGIVPRLGRNKEAAQTAHMAAQAEPNVSVVRAKLAPATTELALPGNTEPINVAIIYARASGYIGRRYADIGTHVKAGQMLAKIESPEVDQELAQARANLNQVRAAVEQAKANLQQAQAGVEQADASINQARANEEIAGATNQRWTRLVDRGVLPKQAGDERRTAFAARQAETTAALASRKTAGANVISRNADVGAAQAAVEAQIANVRRLERMQAFERVLAPFDGVVTERRVEQGDLVSAGGASDRSLFSVAQARTLRIQVNVPQAYSVDLHTGQNAQVTIRERPGKTFTGKVARTAESLNAASRTLLAEVQVDNSSAELLPGMYAQVKFVLPRSRPVVLVPASAFIANSQGTRVLQVTPDRRLRYVTVQAGRDLGAEVEVLSGLSGTETLVTNASDTLADGQEVKIQTGGQQERKK